MKHTATKQSETKTKLTVTLDASELKAAKTTALKHLAPSLKMPGFRPGKVPMNVAEKNMDPARLANEVVEHAINSAINAIAEEEGYRILDRPQVDVKDFKPYDSLVFEAELELLPEITLGDYKKLKAKRGKVKLEKSEIDDVLNRVREQFAEKKKVERAAKKGDETVIDFVGKRDGEAFDGGTAQDYALKLGSDSFIPGFEDAIVGHVPGETFDVPLTFPEDYHAVQLKGAKVVFEVTIKSIDEVVLPKLDDELAKKAGPFQSVAELEEDIRKELTSQKEKAADDTFKDELVGELVAVSTVPVPELLVKDQIESIEKDSLQNLMYRGMTVEQYLESAGYKTVEEWREKELKEAAERRVKAGLVLAELSKVENIQVEAKYLEERHETMTEQYKANPEILKQLDTPEARRDLANRILTEKTVERLIELNSK